MTTIKRSLSESNAEYETNQTKRMKSNNDDTVIKNQEYLQRILARITELQQQLNKDDYGYSDDETSDLGDSESEDTNDDIMQEVLIEVFKSVPGPPHRMSTEFINYTQKLPVDYKIDLSTEKNVELYGFKVCRKVATSLMKHVTYVSSFQNYSDHKQNCNISQIKFDTKKQLLRNFDMHLVAKEKDYAARLLQE